MINEEWKPVLGHEKYFVSDQGRVKSFVRYPEGRILKAGLSSGYLSVVLVKNKIQKSYYIQILVLEAFIGKRPQGMMGLHNDSNKQNNNLYNLRWGSSSDNAQDQIKNGTFNFDKGEKHQLAKLKEKDVIEIKRMIRVGLPQRFIAQQFGVKQQAVSKINLGKRWKHVA